MSPIANMAAYMARRRQIRRARLIVLAGGRCVRCGAGAVPLSSTGRGPDIKRKADLDYRLVTDAEEQMR